MSSKLTKAFAAFVGERGFEIANEDEISQQPGEDYKLARQIFRNKRVLLPFLTKLAVEVNAKKRTFEFHVPNAEDSGHLRNFLLELEKIGYATEWARKKSDFSVQLPSDEHQLRFFRSMWAEQCFRYAISTVVCKFCADNRLAYKMFQNVKLVRKGEPHLFTELDLVIQIEKRFYLFEVKSGPMVNIMQWARREAAFVTEGGPARQIVCTIHDNIPANIFEPQILMTIGGIQNRLKRLLKSETYRLGGLAAPWLGPDLHEPAFLGRGGRVVVGVNHAVVRQVLRHGP